MSEQPDPAQLRYDFGILRTPTRAHGGVGQINAVRVLDRTSGVADGLAFLDLVDMPPGTSIGQHRHGPDCEIYVVVSGSGSMHVDGVDRRVEAGSVIVNRPGGTHGLVNDGAEVLRLVVVDVDR